MITGQNKPLDNGLATECEKCSGRGFIVHMDDERPTAIVCECQRHKRLQRLLKSSNISEEFMEKRFDTFNLNGADERVVKAFKMAKEYSAGLVALAKQGKSLDGVPWFGLLGVPGSGKTHLVTAIVKPLIELGIYPLFFNWIQSFSEWFSYYQSPEETHKVEEIRQKIYNADILIVDDICKASQKDTWIKEFSGVVDYRYRKRKPIIFTSEYYAELIGFLSEATAGRLFEKTVSPVTGKKYLITMMLRDGEDPLSLDYRFRHII